MSELTVGEMFQSFNAWLKKGVGTKRIDTAYEAGFMACHELIHADINDVAAYATKHIKDLTDERDELKAHVNELRESLLLLANGSLDDEGISIALKKTQQQSLSSHNNKVRATERVEPKVTCYMKSECIGEFTVETIQACPNCFNYEPSDDCEYCGGESDENGMGPVLVDIPWDTMKDIYKMMSESANRETLKKIKEVDQS